MAYRRSKEDEVNKISTSIFVTNFPDQFYAKDLWKVCNQYGSVVDAFILNRRSKAGKRFGFVCFVKVFDVDRLVNNLCTIWVDRFKLHANKARFQRPPQNSSNVQYSNKGDEKPASNVGNKDSGIQGYSNSYIHVVRRRTINAGEESKPTIVLDESCLNQNDFSTSLMGKVKEFSSLTNLKVVFANVGFDNIKLKYMGRYWVMIEFQLEDLKKDETCFHSKRICIETKLVENIFKSFKIISKGIVFWLRAKEVSGWIPDFVKDEEEDNDFEDGTRDDGLDVENADKLNFEDVAGDNEVEEVSETIFEKEQSQDHKMDDCNIGQSEMRSEDPFNIYDLLNKKQDTVNGGTNSNNTMKYPPSFTPIGTTDVQSNDFITAEKGGEERSQYTQEGKVDSEISKSHPNNNSKEDKEESICSGHFKKPELPCTGDSMLQVMENLVKVRQIMGYNMEGCLAQKAKKIGLKSYVISTRGEWIPNGKQLLIISIYAPRELSEKKMLWDYLTSVIGNWNGDVVIMGDFNEVRTQDERYGSIYNVQGANAFNSFISDAGLEESKKDNSSNHKKILKAELAEIDLLIDRGEGDSEEVRTQNTTMALLIKKRSQLAIRGILVDGIWIDSPSLAKSEFLSHFTNRFDQVEAPRLQLNIDFPNKMNIEQQIDLECEVSRDEIKRAVWDCGTDKSPGPDGFTFGFYRRYWSFLEKDVEQAVRYFFHHETFSKAGNSSFIVLILKTHNANKVKDFRPITLIGSLYKIISKIMANRLVGVLEDIVNEVQSDFFANRQILDGPFILNELFHWCKKKKKQTMIFKVGFEKAYDSVRWDYLDDVLKNFGFRDRWRGWIQSCLISSKGSVIVNGSPTGEFQFHRSLKQGDSLFPFLFILIMESLHISFKEWWMLSKNDAPSTHLAASLFVVILEVLFHGFKWSLEGSESCFIVLPVRKMIE
ncbi:RNA-directed DNA polymerase, eukaryota [Tanacetum coccineum]